MTDTILHTPLAIDRVERTRGAQDQVRLRCSGTWLTEVDPEETETLLVVQLHGRRHRFAAGAPDTDAEVVAEPGAPFDATFTIPDWAVPEQPGQAVLWIGDAIVAVPPPGTHGSDPVRAEAAPPMGGPEEVTASRVSAEVVEGPTGVGRSGPLAQLLVKETVDALRSELEQRSNETARLRGALAELRSDLEGRSSAQSDLETAHGELREELQRLMAAVGGQREEFERRLADALAERDASRDELARSGEHLSQLRGELSGARDEITEVRDELVRAETELERSGKTLAATDAQLTAVRERFARLEDDLSDARVELTRARAEFDDRLAGERSQFDQRLAAVRAESESSLAIVRERAEAETAIAHERAHAEMDAMREQVQTEVAAAREQSDAELAALRATTEAEASALRSRAEKELAASRAESEAMLAAARGHFDSRALAAEAQSRELSDRLSMLQVAERRRADDLSRLNEQLASAHIARDAALGEADGLRRELERVGSELGALRESAGPPGSDLADARRLLADARALTERLRGEFTVGGR